MGNKVLLVALHDIEEYLRSNSPGKSSAVLLHTAAANRREKEILELAKRGRVRLQSADLDTLEKRIRQAGAAEQIGSLRHLLLEIDEEYLRSRRTGTDLFSHLDDLDDENPLVLVLDGITDPHNLGAIIRSADLFSVAAVVLPKRRSAEVNDTVRKVSAGASHHVPVFSVPNLSRVIEELKKKEFWIYCADLGGSDAHRADLGGKSVLVLGSEGSGPSREVSRHADQIISIASQGHVDSFNVSVAAGILMYEIRRQTGFSFRAGS